VYRRGGNWGGGGDSGGPRILRLGGGGGGPPFIILLKKKLFTCNKNVNPASYHKETPYVHKSVNKKLHSTRRKLKHRIWFCFLVKMYR
jgi:hypothetical protein